MNKVLLIRSSAFKTTRVIRQAKELANSGYHVSILHWERLVDKDHNDNIISSLDFNCQVLAFNKRCEYGKGVYSLFARLGWFLFIIKSILKISPNIVHAVDFDSAFPVYISSKLKRFKLVYDIADFIETFDSNIPTVVRKLVRSLSERIVNSASLIVLPDENRKLNINPCHYNKICLVNNAPNINISSLKEYQLSSELVKIFNGSTLNLFYYGAFNEDRAIRLFLDASKDTRLSNVTFWFAGWGALEDQVSDFQANNVRYVGRLKQVEAISLLQRMDCSLIYYDPSYEHNRLASPNKIFEAMAVGVPVLVSVDTSIDKLVLKENIGYVCDYNIDSLIDTIISIDPEENGVKSRNISALYSEHSWENSASTLRESYAKL
ncbi:glycosyltransferase [Aliivibrio sp. SR45-2]|uniref:glycosyltransferase n=1 Tax=Aliivibrio sp. SR45-2 TaxID=2760931 RepID=UPI0015F85974|nr:glycosyltransferase [Aliivibrio sp. SR45-2]MBB1315936.1 glycosyltransferase [Aliivibrio sp. SR45-2]